jgi:hypothetical protein
MDEIDALIAQIAANGDQVWIAGPQPEAAIGELERALQVRLPPSYRSFILRFGGLGIYDSNISGIIDGQPLGEGTGWAFGDTQRFRQDSGLPTHLIVVQPDEDAPYCLDTRTAGSDGEYPLVCFELHSGHVGRMADSFDVWFVEWLRLQAEQ